MKIQIETNVVKEVDELFKKLNIFIPNLQKVTIRTILNEMKAKLKLNNTYRSKNLINTAIYTKVKDESGKISVSGRRNYKAIIAAHVAESGAKKYPIKGKYLSFQVNGKWIRTKKAEIKPRPFFERTYAEVIARIPEIIQKLQDKLIRKEFK